MGQTDSFVVTCGKPAECVYLTFLCSKFISSDFHVSYVVPRTCVILLSWKLADCGGVF